MTNDENMKKIKKLQCTICNGKLKRVKKDVDTEDVVLVKDIYKCTKCGMTINVLKISRTII